MLNASTKRIKFNNFDGNKVIDRNVIEKRLLAKNFFYVILGSTLKAEF
jgi:hypothetical protein